VALEERARIEERDVLGVLVDDRRGQVAGDDLAEDAVGNAREASRDGRTILVCPVCRCWCV
jgi:hypothetical protein